MLWTFFYLVSDGDPFRDLVSILDNSGDSESDMETNVDDNDEDFIKPVVSTTTDQSSTQQPLCPGKTW